MKKDEAFLYERTGRYFAQAAHGVRELASEELIELGATKTGLSSGGLHFHADRAAAYRIAYESRLVARVLAPLIIFDCHSDKYLHKTAEKMEWERVLDLDTTFAISANVSGSNVRHSLYASQVLKDAIVDRFRKATGKRPSVDTKTPDVALNLHIADNRATISLDLVGEAMHRRGYRQDGGDAPMQETLAAAVLRHTGWDGETPLVDPMCGSGTLLAEAWMHARRLPSGLLRTRWALERLPDFDADTWKRVRDEAVTRRRNPKPGLLTGSDASGRAIDLARENLHALPGGSGIQLRVSPFQQLDALQNVTIVSNPPYGMRLGRTGEAGALMKEFGDFLKQKCSGSTAWLYFGDRELIKSVGLKPARKIPLRAGGLDGRLARYDLW